MSSVPRMRGRRFLRPAAKKAPTRPKKSRDLYEYQEKQQTSPSDVAARILNAIDHLGSQRFALPPFSEHFDRWLTDLQSLLDEFKNRIPQAIDETVTQQINQTMNEISKSLSDQTNNETKKSSQAAELHRRLAECDLELSKLDREYKNDVNELRRQHAKSDRKLRSEIDALDRKRLRMLRKKTNFLQRLFQKSQITIQATDAALESSKDTLRKSTTDLDQVIQLRRNDYLTKRQGLVDMVSSLRQQIQDSSKDMNDALESRQAACQEIRQTIETAMQRMEATTHSAG